MLGGQGGSYRAPQGDEVSAYVLVSVDNVDQHYQHAKECGADVVRPPADMPFGERAYTARDPGGTGGPFHSTSPTSRLRNVAQEHPTVTEKLKGASLIGQVNCRCCT